MLKDQTKFYDDYKCFEGSCSICLKDSHLIDACPITNYIPNREFIIKKLNYSAFQKRNSNNKVNKHKKTNARKNIKSIQTNARKIVNKNDEEISERSISDENEIKISSRNPSKDKIMIPLEYPHGTNKSLEKLTSEEDIFILETQTQDHVKKLNFNYEYFI